MVGESPQDGGERWVGNGVCAPAQRRRRRTIQLFCNVFTMHTSTWTGLHANLYSSKFQPRALKYVDQRWNALAEQAGGGAGGSDQCELRRAGVNHPDLCGEGWWQALPDPL